jgi:hypothetical protein
MLEGLRCVGSSTGCCENWSDPWCGFKPVSYVSTGFAPLTDEEKADRLIAAVLNSIDTWIQQVAEIESAAIPFTGNKARALHLQRSMLSAKQTLRRLAGLPEED